jgi:hypothetical protein
MGTLGALFVLLALLIYHYKRQLNKLESKYDTMFEIINSLVKEVYQVKSDLGEVANMRIQSMYQQQQQNTSQITEGGGSHKFTFNQLLSNMLPTVMDEDYSSSDTEYEQQDESNKQIFIHSGFSEFDISSSAGPINISLGEEEPITLDVSDLNAGVEQEGINQEESSDKPDESSDKPDEKPVEAPQIVIDNIRPAFLDVEVSDLEDDIISVMTSDRRKPYSKMNIQELRQEAANQGITTDVSKMKKHDIATLLRQNRKTKA